MAHVLPFIGYRLMHSCPSVDAFSVLLTHEVYSKNCKDYFQIKTKRINEFKLHKAVVLELFGGVGTGIVALKKLGVGMTKVSGIAEGALFLGNSSLARITNKGDFC